MPRGVYKRKANAARVTLSDKDFEAKAAKGKKSVIDEMSEMLKAAGTDAQAMQLKIDHLEREVTRLRRKLQFIREATCLIS
jgi:hypothetical protein